MNNELNVNEIKFKFMIILDVFLLGLKVDRDL